MAIEAHTSETFIDPVCGMKVQPDRAAGTSEYQGKRYYFCSQGCQQKFGSAPAKYLAVKPTMAHMGSPGLVQLAATAKPKQPNTAPGMFYVCPMDPEVRETKPGACPICGMTLEPGLPTTDQPDGD